MVKHNSVSETSIKDAGHANLMALYLQQEQKAQTAKGKVDTEPTSTNKKLLICFPYNENVTAGVTPTYVQTLPE